MYETLLDVFA